MSSVDDRIVSMQFQNAQFEQKLGDTLKSLDQLNKGLDFTNAQRNLGDLTNASNRFDMGHIGDAVQGVSAKFLALATVGITAISNITNRAVDAGLAFVKSFAFGPIMDGFHEMETAVGATQTILANTSRFGTKLPEVETNLQALNKYADKTIYNFGEMTKNVGLFTNAGIKIGDATSMIKGFSNEAAASGTTAEGAAGAAYQLSQALSAGKITLMDWKSLTNVGMGNKNMQDNLVSIADKMGTLTKAGIDGKTVQGDFNHSLEKGWLSADVMSTYLKIMAGDMDAAKLKSMGFTAAQIKGFGEQQDMAENAATKVRTATQLVGTIKEAIGSGWSETFSIVLGNFEDATTLFTNINNAVGGFVTKASDARNNLLQGWKDLGGRTVLIQGFKDGIQAVSEVAGQLKAAFRDFFPAKTSKDLMNMTKAFSELLGWLLPAPDTLSKLRITFQGFFAILSIGWTVIKEVALLIGSFLGEFRGAGGGVLDLGVKFGILMIKLEDFLVAGGALHRFFLHIHAVINPISDILKDVTGSFKAFVYTLTTGFTEDEGTPIERFALTLRNFLGIFKEAETVVGRAEERFSGLMGIVDRLKSVFDGVVNVLGKMVGYIHQWFSELGQKVADSLKPGDFDSAVDAVGVGLLGGIVLMLRKFLKGGKVDISLGPKMFEPIKEALEGVKGQLKAMQAELKAKALMEIAIALGVLTASIVVLSLIDSAKLTKAMAALAIGFGQLVVVMKLLDTMASGTKEAAKFTILATGMTLISTAALILSGAVAVLGQLGWEELAKGLGAVTAMFAIMVGVAKTMEGNAVGMVAAGLAMIPLATGLVILSGAVLIFSTMSWESLAKGLLGVGAVLGMITGMMTVMPVFSIIAAGIAMIPLATGLAILAGVVLLFGKMSWETMGKGLLALAAALGIIALAMNLMPIYLPLIAIGMLKLAEALAIIGIVIVGLGLMKMETLAKGIGAIAAVLVILTVAMNVMQSAILGAVTIVMVAGALVILAGVIKTLGQLSITELGIALAAIAGVFLVLAVAAMTMQPVLPMLFALGIALGVLGVSFVLFGIGAFLVAKAFEAMSSAGVAGTKAMITSMVLIVQAMPRFVSALISSLAESIGQILKSADLILRLITALLIQILDTIIKLAPKIAEAFGALIDAGLFLIMSKAPALIEAGFRLLIMLLSGFRDHIEEVTKLGVDIIVNFTETLRANVGRLISTGLDLLFSLLDAIGRKAGDITSAGLNLLLSFLAGMINNLYRVIDFAVTVVITLAQTIANETRRIIDAGVDILLNFLAGMINNLYRIVDFAVTVLITMAQTIGNEVGRIIDAGANVLIKFVEGVARDIWRVANKGVDIVIAFLEAIGKEGVRLARGAAQALIDFINGLSAAVDEKAPEIRKAAVKLAEAIVGGITGGLLDPKNVGNVIDAAKGLVKKGFEGAKDWLLSRSPSRRFMQLGKSMAQGVAVALDDDTLAENSAVQHAERIVAAFHETISKIPDSLAGMDELNPVITPVLDLTQVKMGARDLSQLMAGSTITPEVSFDQARLISTTTDLTTPTPEPVGSTTEITFNQNNYSPDALSTNDIYKRTKSALAKAKEGLDI